MRNRLIKIASRILFTALAVSSLMLGVIGVFSAGHVKADDAVSETTCTKDNTQDGCDQCHITSTSKKYIFLGAGITGLVREADYGDTSHKGPAIPQIEFSPENMDYEHTIKDIVEQD